MPIGSVRLQLQLRRISATHFLDLSLASTLSSDVPLTHTNHPLTGSAPPSSSTHTTHASAFASCPPPPPEPGQSSPLIALNHNSNHGCHRELGMYLAGASHQYATRSLALRIHSMLTRSSQGVPLARLAIINHYPDRARIYCTSFLSKLISAVRTAAVGVRGLQCVPLFSSYLILSPPSFFVLVTSLIGVPPQLRPRPHAWKCVIGYRSLTRSRSNKSAFSPASIGRSTLAT